MEDLDWLLCDNCGWPYEGYPQGEDPNADYLCPRCEREEYEEDWDVIGSTTKTEVNPE